LHSYRADLDRRIDAVMKLRPTNRHGVRLRKRFAKIRDNLFVFVTDRDVPYTNNASERALRPSVVFRKSLPPRRRGSPTASARPGAPICSPASGPSSTPDVTTTSHRFKPSAIPSTNAPSSPPCRTARVSNYKSAAEESTSTAPPIRDPADPSTLPYCPQDLINTVRALRQALHNDYRICRI